MYGIKYMVQSIWSRVCGIWYVVHGTQVMMRPPLQGPMHLISGPIAFWGVFGYLIWIQGHRVLMMYIGATIAPDSRSQKVGI